MNEEAKIISKHNLDCSNLENLTKDIANRLDCNIEYGYYQNINGQHEFVQFGNIEVNPKGVTSTIYDMTNDASTEFKYVLELGEEAKLIFNDMIQVIPPWEEEFETAFNNFNSKGFQQEPYYMGIFEDLKKLGGDKVYFIKETFEPEIEIKSKTTATDYLNTIKDKATFFEVAL
ncbi:hypothetical protein [Flavobacterium sp. WC2429]|uniref:DUF4303 domain-containing protein n=1 Tax=Flavobacterium sp. WC2429 TaxID=3234140 RepID=A0AB39WIY4_9FLAO